jgi:hypothetical protein
MFAPRTAFGQMPLALAVVWLLCAVLAPLGVARSAGAEILDLAWDAPVTSADGRALGGLKSYRLYYGTTSTAAVAPPCNRLSVELPALTTHRMTGLTSGVRYYFQLTALDAEGRESGCSNETSAVPAAAVVPAGPSAAPQATTAGQPADDAGNVPAAGAAPVASTATPPAGGQAQGPPGIAAVGPTDPANGYPVWYQDSSGLTLELCLDVTAERRCLLDPDADLPHPGRPLRHPDNFPARAFWWAADAVTTTMGGSGEAVLALALQTVPPEAAAGGRRRAVAQIRMSIDVPGAGTYTVTHPYGVSTFVVERGERRISWSREVSADETGPAAGSPGAPIGPFLTPDPGALGRWTCPAPPPGYLGDGHTECPVVGSPLGTNVFRIEGPGIAGEVRQNGFPCADKPGSPDCVETRRFRVAGKIAGRFGVQITRASYARGARDPGVEVFAVTRATDPARGIPEQDLQVTVAGETMPMTTDGTGRYYLFASGDFAPGTPVQAVNATDAGRGFESVDERALIDVVRIRLVHYVRTSRQLEVAAETTDDVSPCQSGARLSAYAEDGTKLGDLQPGRRAWWLVAPDVQTPPRRVTVRSCFGAEASQLVELVACESGGRVRACSK